MMGGNCQRDRKSKTVWIQPRTVRKKKSPLTPKDEAAGKQPIMLSIPTFEASSLVSPVTQKEFGKKFRSQAVIFGFIGLMRKFLLKPNPCATLHYYILSSCISGLVCGLLSLVFVSLRSKVFVIAELDY